ncbi:MAG: TonB-dependent receptor [Acidobacteria bacterium]|nr:TonB-dependent receptor [Acidobacteriota bacterium]MCI0621766.1 TonB-dependent receptor [Acidobacteriota bacterium]MCI0718664.1 TonB-dependent receptor [Acidobacteriota bacterium]
MLNLPRPRALWTLLWSLALSASTSVVLSQINTADLQGVIIDPANAVVRDATVRVENLQTGLARETKTRENGDYLFLALPPGHYKVSVQAAGFRPAVAEDVVLTIGQQAQLSFTLEISSVVEALVISADAVVETTRSSVATTVDQRAIESLATNGRSYINFTLLDSATTRDNQPVLGPAPTSGLNIGGQRARANMVSIDGADAIDNTTNGVRATLSQEAVQEFQIIKSGYAPEYGRASAATINIVSKQGTNDWRGNLFGYLRSRNGSATNAFAGEPDPGDTRTQAGLTLGGPIEKDKTFVFLSFETNLRNSINFSQIGRNNYGFRNIANPFGSGTLLLTPQQEAYVRRAPAALAGPYAAIASRAAQVAIFGNTAGGPTTFALFPNPLPASFSGLSSEAGNYKTTEETYFYSARFDHQISQNHNAFVRFSATPSDVTGLPSNGQNQLTALNGFSRTTNNSTRDIALVGQLASNLSPSLLSEFRFQFARRGVGLTTNSTRAAVEIPGIASIGLEPFAPVYRYEKRWQFTENLTHIRGAHTYKMGVDFNHLPVKAAFPLNQGAVYYFPAALAVDNPLISAAVTPAVTAAWRSNGAPAFSSAQAYGLGFPESFVQQFGGLERTTSRYKNTTLGWFVQDSWKLAQNFSLNYGLRYDVEFSPRIAASSPLSEAGEKLLKVVQGIPRDTNNWAPRFGFAWDPFEDGQTVVRGSYGLFYGHPLTGIIFLSDVVDGTQSPYLVTPGGVGADDLFQGRVFTPLGSAVANPAIGYIGSQQRYDVLAPAFQNQNTALALSPILSQTLPIAADLEYDYTQQGALGIERQVGESLSLAADYTYTHGSHLLRPRNINQGDFNRIVSYARATTVCPTLLGVAANGCANPAYGGAGGSLAGLWDALGGASATSLAPLGQLLFNQFRATGPNYTWANTVSRGALSKQVMDSLVQAFNLPSAPGNAVVPFFSVKQYESSGTSVYHAMTLTLRKRFSQSYQLLGSWTWSHAIDDSTDLQTLQEPQDNKNPRLDRSNSNFDQRHRLVVSGVFDSPWKSSPILGNWTFSPTIEASSGRPYNLLTLNDSTLINSGSTARPSVVPVGTPGSFASPDGKVGLIQPPLGSVGDLGRNVYRTSNFASVDFRLTRRIVFGDKRRLEFSLDVFNLFNRVNIREADNSFTQAGRPVGAFDPRQLQYSAKVVF